MKKNNLFKYLNRLPKTKDTEHWRFSLKKEFDKLHYLAYFDTNTNLPNINSLREEQLNSKNNTYIMGIKLRYVELMKVRKSVNRTYFKKIYSELNQIRNEIDVLKKYDYPKEQLTILINKEHVLHERVIKFERDQKKNKKENQFVSPFDVKEMVRLIKSIFPDKTIYYDSGALFVLMKDYAECAELKSKLKLDSAYKTYFVVYYEKINTMFSSRYRGLNQTIDYIHRRLEVKLDND